MFPILISSNIKRCLSKIYIYIISEYHLLGTFKKLQKVTIRFVMFAVCLAT